jgi:HD superfamily phosphohydrolase
MERELDELVARGKNPDTERASHEVYSMLMIDRVLRDLQKSPRRHELEIDPQDVCSVIDTAVPPVPHSPLARHGANQLCHELVSGEIDVDRMDYLLRDSRECGVVYGVFDAGRILDSLTLYYDPVDKGVHVAIRISGLAALEDFLRARHSMYYQVYFHKTGSAAEAMLNFVGRKLEGWTLPTDLGEYASLDDHSIAPRLMDAVRSGISSHRERDAMRQVLENLLFERRFWKRVYENVERDDRPTDTSTREEILRELNAMGCRFETLSSSKSLTRMLMREPGERSKNTLRLIKRDNLQRLQVVPIEDFSQSVRNNVRLRIERIYVEDALRPDGTSVLDAVRKKIADLG